MSEQHRHYDSNDAGPEWGTPGYIWKPLAAALNGFDLDPASGAETEPIAEHLYTKKDDGLSKPWFGDVWLNPPYGREFNEKWAAYAHEQAEREPVRTLTALVPAATDTQWFQHHYAHAEWLTFIEGRIEFDGAGDHPASFASVLCTWGAVPHAYMSALNALGFVARTTRDVL